MTGVHYWCGTSPHWELGSVSAGINGLAISPGTATIVVTTWSAAQSTRLQLGLNIQTAEWRDPWHFHVTVPPRQGGVLDQGPIAGWKTVITGCSHETTLMFSRKDPVVSIFIKAGCDGKFYVYLARLQYPDICINISLGVTVKVFLKMWLTFKSVDSE